MNDTIRHEEVSQRRHRLAAGSSACAASTICLALLLVPASSAAQAVSQADVSVVSFDVRTSIAQANAYDITAVVHSEHDDDARSTELWVFLPPDTPAQSWPMGCHDSLLKGAYVVCDLNTLTVGQTVTVHLTVPAPPSFVLPWYTAMAFSQVSDPDFRNNVSLLIADGTLVRQSSDAKVYVIVGGAKFLVPDAFTLLRLYGGWSNVHVVKDGTLVGVGGMPSTGTLLREESGPEVYRIESGKRRHILLLSELFQYGGWALVGVVPNGSLANIPIA